VSTRTSIPYDFSRPASFSAEWLECPIVKTDLGLSASRSSPMTIPFPFWQASDHAPSKIRAPSKHVLVDPQASLKITSGLRPPHTFFRETRASTIRVSPQVQETYIAGRGNLKVDGGRRASPGRLVLSTRRADCAGACSPIRAETTRRGCVVPRCNRGERAMILLVGATGVVRGAYPAVAINGGDELWYVELPTPRGGSIASRKVLRRGAGRLPHWPRARPRHLRQRQPVQREQGHVDDT
jgi:hypothetical protein